MRKFNASFTSHGSQTAQMSFSVVSIQQTDYRADGQMSLLQQQVDFPIEVMASRQTANWIGVDKSLEAAIKTYTALFESSEARGRSLHLVYRYLLPPAVDAKRAFCNY